MLSDGSALPPVPRACAPGVPADGPAKPAPRARAYHLGEMFSGPGGIARGAMQATGARSALQGASRIAHSWAVDYHTDTVETYRNNIHGATDESVFKADVREFDLAQVPPFDAFAFGFPCNDFSSVGERRGLGGDYGALYTYGVHALALGAPEWFIAENVSGLRGADNGNAFGKILAALQHPTQAAKTDPVFAERYASRLGDLDETLEYVLSAHLYRFEDYGLPQKRHRILVVGMRRDIADQLERPFRIPAPTTGPGRERLRQTAEEALANIPDWAENNERVKHPPLVEARIAAIPPGKGAFTYEFKEDEAHLRLNVRGATLSNIYRRLRRDEPAYTVTGSGGGGTHMYHWDEPRALTNRERARLQSFRDDFSFVGGKQSVRRQIGMAVPPDAAQMILTAVLNTLDGIEYESLDHANIDVSDLIAAYHQTNDGRAVLF